MSGGAGPFEPASPVRRALRPLGPHGEGWVGIQTAIAIVVLAAAPLDPLGPLGGSGPPQAVAWAIGSMLTLAGAMLFAWGALTLGPSFSIWVTPREGASLVTRGPYRWTRHPICTAQAVFGFGWALLWVSPVAFGLAVVYAAYLDRCKLRREEQTLVARYPDYVAYSRQVTHRMWPVPPHRGSAAPASDTSA